MALQDVPACTGRGIKVSNVPTAVDDATADTAMFLMLGALRNFALGMHNLRRGGWRGHEHDASLPALGHDPQGKSLGIIGMGGIGRNMARKARAFGMTILYHNRTRLAEDVERELGGAQYCDFETLLKRSDVLSLNLPLNVRLLLFLLPCFPLLLPQPNTLGAAGSAGVLTTLRSHTPGTSSPRASWQWSSPASSLSTQRAVR